MGWVPGGLLMFEEPITGAKGVDIEASKRNWAREDASWKSSGRFYGQGVVNMERRNKTVILGFGRVFGHRGRGSGTGSTAE